MQIVRDAGHRHAFLPARFAQQIFRRECRRLRVVLLREDGRDPAVIDRHHQTNLITPLPVIGSVLLDAGKRCPLAAAPEIAAGRRHGCLRRCNKMASMSVIIMAIASCDDSGLAADASRVDPMCRSRSIKRAVRYFLCSA